MRFATAFVADAVRSVTARQLGVTMVLGLAWYVSTTLFWWEVLPVQHWSSQARRIAEVELLALWMLLAIAIADRAVDRGVAPRRAYMTAAIAGCVVGVLVQTCLASVYAAFVYTPLQAMEPATARVFRFATPFTIAIYLVTYSLLYAGSAVFLYAQWRTARRTEQYLHRAQLDRVRKSRIALESRLQALQARVEPKFLFNTLAQVRDLYDHDAAVAASMLDDLIAYLRAAMPHMRTTSSTLGQEVELVRAYLDIVRLRLSERLAFDIDVPQDIGHARIPPMTLLPLIDEALARSTGLAHRLHISALQSGQRLQLTIADTASPPTSDAPRSVAVDIRARLAALYGDSASLVLRPGAATTEFVLSLPFEAAAAGAQDSRGTAA
jgi:sensor histidine kinase YesM